jgi:hypothetical protein
MCIRATAMPLYQGHVTVGPGALLGGSDIKLLGMDPTPAPTTERDQLLLWDAMRSSTLAASFLAVSLGNP